MIAYWLLFGFFALGSLSGPKAFETPRMTPGMLLGALVLIGLIGFRYEVGADWIAYKNMFSYASLASFAEAVDIGDPAYQTLNWIAASIGGEFWLVNVWCAAIFVFGLVRLANVQPSPFLAIVIAIPYLVIVVSMGYTRQAAAIGLVMAGLATLDRTGSAMRFAAYVTLAAFFHKSAVIVIPLVIFSGRHNRFLNVVAGIALTYWLYTAVIAQSVEYFQKSYMIRGYSSQGAAIRVAMSIVPAALYLLVGKRLRFNEDQAVIWRTFSIVSFVMLVALFVSPSTTAIDRIALYVIPLQIVVLSRAYFLFDNHSQGKFAVVLYAGVIQFTWLNFAAHAEYWVPYHFYPISF